MNEVKIISPIQLGYRKKPINWSKDCDLTIGWGLFWIEEVIVGEDVMLCPCGTPASNAGACIVRQAAPYYRLNSFPESRVMGTCGTCNKDFVFSCYNDLVLKKYAFKEV